MEYPVKGKGIRQLSCEMYSACLEIASAENWEDFYCPEDCPEFIETRPGNPIVKGAPVQKKKSALCEECKTRPVLSPGGSLCPSCMAKRSHKVKKGASKEKKPKKAPSKKQPPRTGVDAYVDRAEAGAEPIITVHFDNHREILGEIQRLAEEETRTLELQVIHMIKSSLTATQKDLRQGGPSNLRE